jgi:hypothetical protein
MGVHARLGYDECAHVHVCAGLASERTCAPYSLWVVRCRKCCGFVSRWSSHAVFILHRCESHVRLRSKGVGISRSISREPTLLHVRVGLTPPIKNRGFEFVHGYAQTLITVTIPHVHTHTRATRSKHVGNNTFAVHVRSSLGTDG